MSLTDFSSGAAASPGALLVETHQMQKWKILTQSMKNELCWKQKFLAAYDFSLRLAV